MSADGLTTLRNSTQNLLKVYYSGLHGTVYENNDLQLGKIDAHHIGFAEMDLQPARVVVYRDFAAVDIVYLENTSLDVSRFVLENLDKKVSMIFTQYDIKDKKTGMCSGPYYLLKAMPTSYSLFDVKGNRSSRPVSGWLVTWSLAISPYLPKRK
jgi:hypothetical protein